MLVLDEQVDPFVEKHSITDYNGQELSDGDKC